MFRLHEAGKILGLELSYEDRVLGAACIDTRKLNKGDLFFAMPGEHVDGHVFVAKAAQLGACAAVVLRDVKLLGDIPENFPLLHVTDVLIALQQIAREWRNRHDAPVVGVTGSNGKTSTKELIATALGVRGKVHCTQGNLNNHIGMPLSLLAWPQEAWAAVLEMGMRAPGEITALARLARPTIGVITNIAPAHLGPMGSLEAIARAKGEMFESLPDDGIGFVNLDDPYVCSIAEPLLGQRKRITFGRDPKADIRILSVGADPRVCPGSNKGGHRGPPLHNDHTIIDLNVMGTPVHIDLPLLGLHFAYNTAVAMGIAQVLGVDVQQAAHALSLSSVPGGRMRVLHISNGEVTLVDDTYNANPSSMIAALTTLGAIEIEGERIAVLGDMLEMGPDSAKYHHEVGREAARAGFTMVYGVGERAGDIVDGAKEGGADGMVCLSTDDVIAKLLVMMHFGDWILCKGSRGMHMERVVQGLLEAAP